MDRTIKKYGIFLIPQADVCREISKIKSEVALLDSKAAYLTHPVHSTIFLFNTHVHHEVLVQYLEDHLIELKQFEVKITGWHVFYNDILTQKHTLTIGLVRNQILNNLQVGIADKIIQLPTEPNHYKCQWEGDYEYSYAKWGYPFVGSHWIPHITVASLENKSDIAYIQEKHPLEPTALLFSTIALFLIDNDEHRILHSFDLK
ncbi:MAG: 2'-5' RNA ligase family protein [Sediminibacterium sp.]